MSARPPNPLGPVVKSTSCPLPSNQTPIEGETVTLVGLSPDHAESLYPCIGGEENGHLWDYMFDEPYTSQEAFKAAIASKAASKDPLFYAIVLKPEDSQASTENERPKIVGFASLMRIDQKHQSIEVGNIMYSAALQRTRAATEVMYLLAKYAFEDLGYRRYEWKCHALNAPSNRAARRLGFVFEGTFRKHYVVKGRSRDTSWYSITDDEWPKRKAELEQWLGKENFDIESKQRKKLEDFRAG